MILHAVIAAVSRKPIFGHLAVLIGLHAVIEFDLAAHVGFQVRSELKEVQWLVPTHPTVPRFLNGRVQEQDAVTSGDLFGDQRACRDDLSHRCAC
jgi:hypothetical protein